MDFESLAASEFASVARKLANAAEARVASEVAAAAALAQADIDAARSDRDAARADADVARNDAFAARTDADAARAEADALRYNAESLLAQAETARAEAETARAEAQAALIRADARVAEAIARAETEVLQVKADVERAVAAARANEGGMLELAREEASTAVATVKAEAADAVATARAEAQAETAAVRAAADAEISALRTAADTAARTNASFGAMIEKLRNDHTQLAAENERLAAEHAALSYERADMLEQVAASGRGPILARLGDVVAHVASAGSVEDVLAAAASGLVGEFARIAVFTARDNALAPAFHRGFDLNSGLDKVVVPLGVDSFLSKAAHTTEVQSLRGAAAAAAPFGGAPALCVTAPIAVRGEVLGVIYADDAGQLVEPAGDHVRLDLAKVLRAHATLRLERLTVELKAIAELRAYAQMLLDEVEYVYDADASSNKPEGERVERLAENLRCARQIYAQRVTPEGPAAAGLLDEIVARAVERKGAQPFGRDLRMAHGRLADAEQPRAKAQAS